MRSRPQPLLSAFGALGLSVLSGAAGALVLEPLVLSVPARTLIVEGPHAVAWSQLGLALGCASAPLLVFGALAIGRWRSGRWPTLARTVLAHAAVLGAVALGLALRRGEVASSLLEALPVGGAQPMISASSFGFGGVALRWALTGAVALGLLAVLEAPETPRPPEA